MIATNLSWFLILTVALKYSAGSVDDEANSNNALESNSSDEENVEDIIQEDYTFDIVKSYSFEFDEVNWITANARCISKNMHLLSISGAKEAELINAKLGALTTITKSNIFWMSGIRDDTYDVFRWWDLKPFGYANWGEGQPDNYLDSENCVFITIYGLWNDVSCAEKYAYICEKYELIGPDNLQSICCAQKIECENCHSHTDCNPKMEADYDREYAEVEMKINQLKAKQDSSECSGEANRQNGVDGGKPFVPVPLQKNTVE